MAAKSDMMDNNKQTHTFHFDPLRQRKLVDAANTLDGSTPHETPKTALGSF